MQMRLRPGAKPSALVRASSAAAPQWNGMTGGGIPPVPAATGTHVAYSDERSYLDRFIRNEPTSNATVGRDLYIVPVGGGEPKRVTDNAGDQAYPDLASGRRVLWLDGARGMTDLMMRSVP